mgnify:CR=1
SFGAPYLYGQGSLKVASEGRMVAATVSIWGSRRAQGGPGQGHGWILERLQESISRCASRGEKIASFHLTA